MATARRINSRLPDELNRLFRVSINAAFGIAAAFLAIIVLGADKHAEFAFNDTVVFVGGIQRPVCRLQRFSRAARDCHQSYTQ